MNPFSNTVWVCILFAYISVNIVLFVVTRFSPNEWYVNSDDGKLKNDFNFSNTIWFCSALLMQQGVDIVPKSTSGRLATSVWRFFTLIIISSYTANLAAFLTIERLEAPIEKVEDLAKQANIKVIIQFNFKTNSPFLKFYFLVWYS
jgi:ionotropic glutamate receptor